MSLTVSTKTMGLEALMWVSENTSHRHQYILLGHIFFIFRRRAPVCGVAAHAVRRQLLNQPREQKILGNNKQVFQSYVPSSQSGSDRGMSSRDMYSQIRRGDESQFRPRDKFIPPRRPRMGHGSFGDLSAIEVRGVLKYFGGVKYHLLVELFFRLS